MILNESVVSHFALRIVCENRFPSVCVLGGTYVFSCVWG